jgi:hypothetical protein
LRGPQQRHRKDDKREEAQRDEAGQHESAHA